MITFDFYRKPVSGLRTKEDVLSALNDALEEIQEAIIAGKVSSSDLSEAMTFLKRFYERLERLILGDGKVDYTKLLKMQAEDPVLQQAKRRFERHQQRINKQ